MLDVRDLHAGYGASQVLQGIDLSVGAGEVVSLLGRNGSGRSTTLKAIMGEVPPRGTIQFRGRNIAGLRNDVIARLGIGHVPEQREIFPTLSVRQNLQLGQKPGTTGGLWTPTALLDRFPDLARRADVPGGALSGGEQQLLSLCRTLVGNPDLLLVDEPTEGLAPQRVADVAELLQDVARQGTGILLVEQKLHLALRLSQRVYVLGHGQIVHQGTPANLMAADTLRAEWLEI